MDKSRSRITPNPKERGVRGTLKVLPNHGGRRGRDPRYPQNGYAKAAHIARLPAGKPVIGTILPPNGRKIGWCWRWMASPAKPQPRLVCRCYRSIRRLQCAGSVAISGTLLLLRLLRYHPLKGISHPTRRYPRREDQAKAGVGSIVGLTFPLWLLLSPNSYCL